MSTERGSGIPASSSKALETGRDFRIEKPDSLAPLSARGGHRKKHIHAGSFLAMDTGAPSSVADRLVVDTWQSQRNAQARRCQHCTQLKQDLATQANQDLAETSAWFQMTCAVCKEERKLQERDAAKRKNIKRRTKWVCSTCTSRGFSEKNTEAYTCVSEDCDTAGGHQLFDGQDIRNKRRGKNTGVKCKQCKENR